MSEKVTVKTPKQLGMRQVEIADLGWELKSDEQAARSINYAYGLIIVFFLILLFGLTMLYSTSYGTAGAKFFSTQLMWTGIGMGCAGVVFVIGYKRLAEYSIPLIVIICILLIFADFFFPPVNGANRWIRLSLGSFKMSLQPSELAKPTLILFLAKYCAENLRSVNDFFSKRGPLVMFAIVAPMLFLVLLGKDLGTTVLLGSVMCIMLFAAGLKVRYFLIPMSLIPIGYVFIKNYDPMRWARITSFTNPELYLKTDGYQLWNSQLALGSGGWLGIGFMESRLKAKYLPEAHTDFILAIVGEELGMISLIIVMIAYLLFGFFALSISCNSRTRLGTFLGFGVASMIVVQAGINIGVVSGALPTKGIPAPLISYGGSNLLMSLICMGLLLSIAADTALPGFNDEIFNNIKKYFRKLTFRSTKK